MARVDWAIPCHYAEVSEGLATLVGAGIDTVWVGSVPAPVAFMLAIRVVLGDHELHDEHELGFKIYDPAMVELRALATPFRATPNPNRQPGFESGSILPTAHRFEVDEFGSYTIEIVVDGHSETTVPMLVRDQRELERPAAPPA